MKPEQARMDFFVEVYDAAGKLLNGEFIGSVIIPNPQEIEGIHG